MADATLLPTYANNKFFFWNAKLTDSLDNDSSDQGIYWDTVPVDENGATITGSFLIAARNARRSPRRTEMMWVPAAAVSADGLSATGVIRGLKPSGLDYTTGDSDFIYEFDSGDEVFCAILPQDGELMRAAIQGLIATGANNFRIGDNASGDKTIYAQNADASKPFIRFDDTSNQWIISNDGVSSFVPGTGAGAITGGDGISVTAGDIDVDVTDTTVFKNTTAGAADAGKIPRLNASGLLDYSFLGTAGTVDAAALNTLTGGPSSNADSEHTHSTINVQSYTAYEAITENDAVAVIPVEHKWFTQLTDTNVSLGSSNPLRKYAVKYVATRSGTLTDWNFRAREAVNGATALGDLIISFQTDSGSQPSGTLIDADATVTIDQTTQRTWTATMGTRTATFPGAVSFTAGQVFWEVRECSATDATNYLIFGANDTYVNNQAPTTRLTYNLDTATWGSSSTTSILFGWSNTTADALGFCAVQTDANHGARTWNFKGFATSTVAAFASVSLEEDVATLSSADPTAIYYLSTTAGALTTSLPDIKYNGTSTIFGYKVAEGISTTQVRVLPGEKYVWGTISASVTTTTQIITWFRMKLMTVKGGYVASGTRASLSMDGIYDGTNNNVVEFISDDGGAESMNLNTSQSFGNSGGTDYSGVGANITNAGVTYTVTRSGAPSGAFSLRYELTA